jgi:UDP-3-O-[3-hydroxymyristoyl] glucosamine N-acyltransferase
MKFTAEQIAGILEGEVIGNPNAEVHVLSKIEEGKELTFVKPKIQPSYL